MTTLIDPSTAPASLSARFGYVGPGPGLSMAWALIGLLATLFVAAWAVALWPIRVVLRRWRQKRATHPLANLPNSDQ